MTDWRPDMREAYYLEDQATKMGLAEMDKARAKAERQARRDAARANRPKGSGWIVTAYVVMALAVAGTFKFLSTQQVEQRHRTAAQIAVQCERANEARAIQRRFYMAAAQSTSNRRSALLLRESAQRMELLDCQRIAQR